MAFFRYQYTGSNGQVLEGTVQASDAQQAQVNLASRGIQGARIINAPGQALDFHPVRTKRGTDKQRYFLFSQIAQQLRAGINPARTFENLVRVMVYGHYRDSFIALQEAATNGKPLSSVFALYPDLYPDHVVGTIHAGEQGGFLPEAFALLSAQAGEAHKFRRFHWFVYPILITIIVTLPSTMAFRATLDYASKNLDAGIFSIWFRYMAWPYGPMTLAIIISLLLLRAIMSTYGATRLRHRISLKIPVYGSRSRNECIATFTWALARLSKAGIPPGSSWQMATEVVPNAEMAARLRQTGRMMNDGSKLSDAIFGSQLFPQEYAPVVSTGELTGDIEGSLNQLEEISRTEFEAKTAMARSVGFRVASVLFFAMGGLALIIVVKTWYVDVYSNILNHFE
jgi:type II secretory pathway component PulF